MKTIALAEPDERASLFQITSQRLGEARQPLPPDLVEKDFWVCWMLQRLFALEEIAPFLLFKGGTTLSKAYNAIQRFSEDIDISVSREFLRPGDGNFVENAPSKRKEEIFIKELVASFHDAVAKRIFPSLLENVESELTAGTWKLGLDPDNPGTILFDYPPASILTTSYNRPTVRIEMGGRNDVWPSEPRTILAYAAIAGENICDPVLVPVLAVQRTFWEKATILHSEYHKPPGKGRGARISRHYYDLVQLAQHPEFGPLCKADRDVLARVVEHKTIYYRDSYSHYSQAMSGEIRLVPPDEFRDDLSADYTDMLPMIFEDAPTFEQLVDVLRELETEMNATDEQ